MTKSNSTINVADAKKRFSEILNEVVYHKKRYVISRHGKPMVGLLPAEEMKKEKSMLTKNKGFLSLVGLWEDFEGLDEMVADIYRKRNEETSRLVPSFEDD